MLIIWFALHADGAIHWKQSLALTNGLLLCAKNRIPQIGSATRTSQPQTMPPRRDSTHLSRVGESGQVALNVRRNRYVIIILFMIIIISVNFDYVHILSSAISERTNERTNEPTDTVGFVMRSMPSLHSTVALSILQRQRNDDGYNISVPPSSHCTSLWYHERIA